MKMTGRSTSQLRIWGILLAALVLSLLTISFVPRLLVTLDTGSASPRMSPAQLASAVNDRRATLLQAIGGLALAAGAFATWRTIGINREGQITDRFTKAIEQLGSTKLDVRVGAIYALERVARDSPTDHWTVMEVLTAFIRENSHGRDVTPSIVLTGERLFASFLKSDIQAALTVIARRISAHDPSGNRLNLIEAHLPLAELEDANLSGAILTGAQLSQPTSWTRTSPKQTSPLLT